VDETCILRQWPQRLVNIDIDLSKTKSMIVLFYLQFIPLFFYQEITSGVGSDEEDSFCLIRIYNKQGKNI